MFCEKCGTRIDEGDLFCPACGERAVPEDAEELSPPAEEKPAAEARRSDRAEGAGESQSEMRSAGFDPTERHELVILSEEEAQAGCRKTLDIDGRQLVIDLHPRYDADTSMFFEGYGYEDKTTGKRGMLKVDFLIQ